MSLASDNLTGDLKKLTLFLPASYIRNNHINLLICGPPGQGKSATGNSILGVPEFTCGGESDRGAIKSVSINYDNYRVKVVDCPSSPLLNPGNKKDVLESCRRTVPKLLKLCSSGFHAAIVVLKFRHCFCDQDEFVMAMMKAMFGEDFVRRCVICVISHGDVFRKVMEKSKTPQKIHEWRRAQNGDSALGRMLQACGYRCVLFDNFTDDVNVKREQLQQLMSLVISAWTQRQPESIVSVTPAALAKADIHIVVESALTYEDYRKQLVFVWSYVISHRLGPGFAQVSITILGRDQHLTIDSDQLKHRVQIAKAILNAPYLKASAGTYVALMTVRRESLGLDPGARPGVKHVVVLVTEGRTENESQVIQEACTITKLGVEIMVVSTACMNHSVLARLASGPGNIFIADDNNELEDLTKEVVKRTVERGNFSSASYEAIYRHSFSLESGKKSGIHYS